ncbi:MAG: hypothetical protein IJA58_07980 [Lachnospiraceae bacterium]|nr:hypothetical protein [Lachnospiraceae bacterium]
METPVLRINQKKYAGETTIISMRVPKEMLRDIDTVASVTGRNRNEILTTCIEFALKHMEVETAQEE